MQMVLKTPLPLLVFMVRSRKPMLRTLFFGYTQCAAGISHPHTGPAAAPSSADEPGDAPDMEGGGRGMPKAGSQKRGSSRGAVATSKRGADANGANAGFWVYPIG